MDKRDVSIFLVGGISAIVCSYLWTRNREKSWNDNWDGKGKHSSKPQNDELGRYQCPKGKRTITLIRHGQYKKTSRQDPKYYFGINNTASLTENGIQQARRTGQRLAEMGLRFDEIYCATFTRAMETAQHIVSELKLNDISEIIYDEDLNEGLAAMIEPYSFERKPHEDFLEEMDLTKKRIHRAFTKYIHRREKLDTGKDREDVLIIGHANTSRYFLMKALQLPENAWARFNMNNASISRIYVYDDGVVNLSHVGDSGHLDSSLLTNNRMTQSI